MYAKKIDADQPKILPVPPARETPRVRRERPKSPDKETQGPQNPAPTGETTPGILPDRDSGDPGIYGSDGKLVKVPPPSEIDISE